MDGYLMAGTWVIAIAIIFAAPTAVAWALATHRGRRRSGGGAA